MITLTDLQDQMRQQAAVAEKRRKDREREDQAARDGRGEPAALTGAHVAARAEMDAAASERAAVKGYQDRGATPGPDEGMPPGQIEPQDFRRGYLEQGHARRSPQAEAPRTSPMPPAGRGILAPVELPAGAVVSGSHGPAMQGIAAHQARAAATAGRPPTPRGSA